MRSLVFGYFRISSTDSKLRNISCIQLIKKTAPQQSPVEKHSLAGLKCNPAVSFQTVQMNTTFQVINVFMSPPRFTKTLTINPPLLPTVELCLLEHLT